jgi:hypothetical protein
MLVQLPFKLMLVFPLLVNRCLTDGPCSTHRKNEVFTEDFFESQQCRSNEYISDDPDKSEEKISFPLKFPGESLLLQGGEGELN